jgi:ferredoxin-NADP reductase
MAVRVTEKSRVLIDLPMMIFLRLADGDGKLTAREMERFEGLLAARAWCRSPLLRRSLANTEGEKAALWKRYAAGELRTGIDQVAASVDTVLSSLAPEERADIERDLLHFCREIVRAARAAAGIFHRDADVEAEHSALRALLQRPSARAAQKVETKAKAPPKPAAVNIGALLSGDVGAEMFWQRGKLLLRCVEVLDETHDVRTFRFVAEPPKLFRYYPGQFMTIEVPVSGTVVRRSYTISASPSRPHVISVTIKRIEGGQISNWLHDNLSVGSSLFADGPHGKFTCIDDAGPFLFISAGSGVTPLMAMSRWLYDTAPGADIRFLHFARTPQDIVFEHELRLMARQHTGFRCEFVCSRAGGASGWAGRAGRISPAILNEACPDFDARSIYVCGPVAFMEATRTIIEEHGFPMDRFHEESFGGVPRHAKATGERVATIAKVVFSTSKIEVDCKGSDYVLDLALARELPVAYSCRAGQCGTCKVTLLEGSVEHDCADGLTSEDAKDGLILACQARPTGRIVVDL